MDNRITLRDTPLSAIAKMADGNPGAVNVMFRMIKEGGEIDPDSFMGGIGHILSLDTYKIYGHRIWMLFKDVCGENIEMTVAVLRACHFGFISEFDLNHAIDNCGNGIDIINIIVYYVGIPIEDLELLMIHGTITGLFLFVILYLYVKSHKKPTAKDSR